MTKKRKIRVWLELPIAGADPIEDEIKLEPWDDPEAVGREMIDLLYQNTCPSGWEIVEEDNEDTKGT